MMTIVEIIGNFGASLAVLLSLGQWARRMQFENVLLALAFLSIGLWLFKIYPLIDGAIEVVAVQQLGLFASLFGPSTFLYLKFIAGKPQQAYVTTALKHYLSSVLFVFFVPLLLMLILDVDPRWMLVCQASYILCYFLFFSFRSSIFALFPEDKGGERLQIKIVVSMALLNAATFLVFAWTNDPIVGAVVCVKTSFILVYIFVVGHRYPHLIQYFIKIDNIKEKNTIKSKKLLAKLDMERIQLRLEAAMTQKQIYQNFGLKLEQVAKMVGLNTHQLSAFINNHLNTNFYSYINSFRISEAKQILKTNKHIRITDVSYYVGFSSTSSFNVAFIKEVGLTPSEFKKQFAK